jgi:hypothetical protein
VAGNVSSQPVPPGIAGRRPWRPRRQHIRRAQIGQFIQAVRDGDREVVDESILRLSRSRRWLAPLALAVGAFATLFDGVKTVKMTAKLVSGREVPPDG